MKELTVEITNESGLHARPATAFTQLHICYIDS
ncbi:MAG: HPr family phosphocarrier protein [Veillonella sp.]|nr:HPr family phosphocarrier protein [Veillonella sp.]